MLSRFIKSEEMDVKNSGIGISRNVLSKVSNGVHSPKYCGMMNPVKFKSEHKFYKLRKSGSVDNKSDIDSVVMGSKQVDKKNSLLFTDNSQQSNFSHPLIDGFQQSSICSDINESSSASFPLNNVVNKLCGSSKNTVYSEDKDHRSVKPVQQEISSKAIDTVCIASKSFADPLTKRLSCALDSTESCQKKKQDIGEKNKRCRKGKSSKTSPVKKGASLKNKCGRDQKDPTIEKYVECDETVVATIHMKRTNQEIPKIVAQERMLDPSFISSDTALLKNSELFGTVESSSTSPGSVKSFEMTVMDVKGKKQTKTRSLSVKDPLIQKKRKRTHDHLKKDSPRMSRLQRHNKLIESRNAVDLTSKLQNKANVSTTGSSNENDLLPDNLSSDSNQTDCKSKFISQKIDSDISLHGYKNQSSHSILKADQLTENSYCSRKLVQTEICAKLMTPSKCVVVLPKELRESTNKSATLLSGNSPTSYKSETIQNLDFLSQKHCRDPSPANMSPVRLSKDVISSPIHESWLSPYVICAEPNKKESVLAEFKQLGQFFVKTLNSDHSESVLEDQTSEANPNSSVSVLFPNTTFSKRCEDRSLHSILDDEVSVLFPNTTFNKRCEDRSLHSILDDEETFDTLTPGNENLKSCHSVSMSEECDNSVATAEGSVSNRLVNSSNITGSLPPAEDDFRDSINLTTSNDLLTDMSTALACPTEELPVTSCTPTQPAAELVAPLISANNEATLSLYLSSDERSDNGDDCSLDKSCDSVIADPVNIDENLSGSTNNDVMETDHLAGFKATSDSSQHESNIPAQHIGSLSSKVIAPDSCREDKSFPPLAAEETTNESLNSTTNKENKAAKNDQCISEKTVPPSRSTIYDSAVQKQGMKTKSMKKVRQRKSSSVSLTTVKNVKEITASEYIKPKRLQKPRKSVKHKKILKGNLDESVKNGENCNTFVVNALVHANSEQHTSRNVCKTPRSPLSSDSRSKIVLRSSSKSATDDLPAAIYKHNPILQTSLHPLKSSKEQESSSLYQFSQVATTYAYGAVSSADFQRLTGVLENKLLTDSSNVIKELTSSASIATIGLNTESVNICDMDTTNLPSTDVTECNNASPCINRPIENSNQNSANITVKVENNICERDQIDGKESYQDFSITADDEDCIFEGFHPSDMVKKVQSADNSFYQPKKSGNEDTLSMSIASDENCSDASRTDLRFKKRSGSKHAGISKRKRSLRGSSLADLVSKDNLSSTHKLSPTKVTNQQHNELTTSAMVNVNKVKVSSLQSKRKIRFKKQPKKMSIETIDSVGQTEEQPSKPLFPKSYILPSLAINKAKTNMRPTLVPNDTTTTTITGSTIAELEKTHVQSSQTLIEYNIGINTKIQPSVSNNVMSNEKTLHKSRNTSFDIQDHNDNPIETLPEEFSSDISCNKTVKGCTVRCPDPRSDPPGTPYKCLTCSTNNSFKSLLSLLQHIMVVHATAPPTSVAGSAGPSITPFDCVDTIASSPRGEESNSCEANEQTPIADIGCEKEARVDGAPGDRCDDVDDCSEAVDSECDTIEGDAEVLSSKPGVSDWSDRDIDNQEVSTKISDNEVVNDHERDNCNSLVERTETENCNDQRKDTHCVKRKQKKTSDVNRRTSETDDVKRKKTTDRNLRIRDREDANKHSSESDDMNISDNNVMKGKKTISSRISVNNDKLETYAVKSKRSRSSDINNKRSKSRDVNGKSIVTMNCTKIEPNNSTSNSTRSKSISPNNSTSNNILLDNADRKGRKKLKIPEGDRCSREQHSTKPDHRVCRKSKTAPCLPLNEENKPPPIVMNPYRPRKDFVPIPTMTPDDVERLVCVQRKAFNDAFSMKRKEIIANSKEAGFDVSKQCVMVKGKKRYRCEICHTSASTIKTLFNHMVTHYSSELPEFSCAFCPKTFRYGNTLKLHLEKHGNIMRFFCPVCKLGFQQEAKMRYHIMLHAQKKQTVFGCKKCDKKFNSTALLAVHSKVHYPDLKYRCRQCDFVCIGRGGLSKHIKDEHRTTLH